MAIPVRYRRRVIPPPVIRYVQRSASAVSLDSYCPAGTVSLTVRCWGAGGGAAAASGATPSGGGGGGAYAAATKAYTRGSGGLVFAGSGGQGGVGDGDASWVTASNPTDYFVYAPGGQSSTGVTGGRGGLKVSCIGGAGSSGGNGKIVISW